jgi:hypothetical protein
MVVRLPGEVRMTVLCPNTDDAERLSLPGAGVQVRLGWEPKHMHLVRSTADGPEPVPDAGQSEDDLPEQAMT